MATRSLSGEAVFIDIEGTEGGSLAVVFREGSNAPRLLITGCNGDAMAISLGEYKSEKDGFPDESVGRLTIHENGADEDVIRVRGVEEGTVRVDYTGQYPRVKVGEREENEMCLYRGKHEH